jgi:hypothetical protein
LRGEGIGFHLARLLPCRWKFGQRPAWWSFAPIETPKTAIADQKPVEHSSRVNLWRGCVHVDVQT